MSDKETRRARRRVRGARFAAGAIAVAAAMVCAWAAGYAARSPLGRSEPLTSLIDFEPAFVGRCPNLRAAWEQFRALPTCRAFAATLEGGELLSSAPWARAAARIEERGRVLGRPMVDVFDLVGGEVVVVGVRARDGALGVACISRLGGWTSLRLGAYAATRRTEPMWTPAGEWWVAVEEALGLGWTKVGDVLVVSNDAALLSRTVASVRNGGRGGSALAGLLSSGDALEVGVRIPRSAQTGGRQAGGRRAPTAGVFSVRFGMVVSSSGAAGPGPAAGTFRDVALDWLPADTCAGAVWKFDPVTAWQLLLGALPEAEADNVVRYVDDRVCALLGAEDFEGAVLGRLTGDQAVVMSHVSDPWLGLASGQSAPTLALVVRLRDAAALAERLPLLLAEAAGTIRSERSFAAEVEEIEQTGHRIWALRVSRAGGRDAASAGFVVVSDGMPAGESLLVVSTSVEWLRRALEVRAGAKRGVRDEEWFRSALRSGSQGGAVFAFARGDLVAKAFHGVAANGADRADAGAHQNVGRWLALLGTVAVAGGLGEDGVVRADVWVLGESSGAGVRGPVVRRAEGGARAHP